MPTIPLSIRIDSDLKKALDDFAVSDNRSTSSLATELIERYIETRNNKRLAIEQALQEADKGEFVSHEKMREWFASLGSNNELSFPAPDVLTNNKS